MIFNLKKNSFGQKKEISLKFIKELKEKFRTNCKFCGRPAGFILDHHHSCLQKFSQDREVHRQKISRAQEWSRQKITRIVQTSMLKNSDLQQLSIIKHNISEIAKSNHLSDSMVKSLIEAALKGCINRICVTEDEQSNVVRFIDYFSVECKEVSKMSQSIILRDLENGKFPEQVSDHPFLLQKKERPVHIFQDVIYRKCKTKSISTGGSVRVVNGLWLRSGERIQENYVEDADIGILGVTNKHIRFHGEGMDGFAIKYDKLSSIKPYTNGIKLHEKNISAKPIILMTNDAGFLYNLLCTVKNMNI